MTTSVLTRAVAIILKLSTFMHLRVSESCQIYNSSFFYYTYEKCATRKRNGYESSRDPFGRSATRENENSISIGNSYDIDWRGGSCMTTPNGVVCKCIGDFSQQCGGKQTVYFSNGCVKCFEFSKDKTRIRGCCATALTHDAFKLGLYAVHRPEQATPRSP